MEEINYLNKEVEKIAKSLGLNYWSVVIKITSDTIGSADKKNVRIEYTAYIKNILVTNSDVNLCLESLKQAIHESGMSKSVGTDNPQF